MPINTTCEPGSTIKNHTGGWRTYIPKTDLEKCISCGTCARVCPENCIKMTDATEGEPNPSSDKAAAGKPTFAKATTGKPKTDYNFCKGCGLCAAECPVKCIAMEIEIK